MKHLVAPEHHPHLKKRAILECGGLVLLTLLSYQQRDLLGTAISSIRSSDVFYLFLLCATYWVLLPLTSISYRILAKKKIPLSSTMLAQLAGAGPGRIIPGGLGHLSIGAVHLHHIGFTMQRALVLTVTNNLVGLLTNAFIVVAAIVIHPDLLNTLQSNASPLALALIISSVLVLASLFLWLSHARNTRKAIRRFVTQAKIMLRNLLVTPNMFIRLFIIASFICLGHATMLTLAGKSLAIELSFIDAIIALSAGVIIGGAVPTPGGVGAVEAGTISALILLGYDAPQATSIALLFRVATYWQPLVPGLVAYLYLREKKLL